MAGIVSNSLCERVLCLICGASCPEGRVTCSEECHENLVYTLENEFGIYKKVVDIETGKTHKVPTRDIIEKGLKYRDLKNYPEWRKIGL
jgi:hypothetical protein